MRETTTNKRSGFVPAITLAALVTLALLVLSGGSAHAVLPGAPGTANVPAVPMAEAALQEAGLQNDRQWANFLADYCVTCHNQFANVGGLALDTKDFTNVAPDAATWEKVVRKIRTGLMPPSGASRPQRSVLDAFAGELEIRLDLAAALAPNPGSPALRRLNRTEYGNAVRDLLALDVDVTAVLPQDDSVQGFDNIGEALSVSPAHIDGYISAAMKISRLAVGDMGTEAAPTAYSAPAGLLQDRHIEGMPVGTRGGMTVQHTFPLDAEYQISVGGARGGGYAVLFNGERLEVANPANFRVPVIAGPHSIAVAVLDRQRTPANAIDSSYSDFRIDDPTYAVTTGVTGITINGPFNPTSPGESPSRRQIFVCYPQNAAEELPCAREILQTLAHRAFRRPVSEAGAEMETLMGFYRQGFEEGGFETGIQYGVARVLASPAFLFRAETEPAGLEAGRTYSIGDLELAGRLAAFLWSSIPDEALLQAAETGRLSDPAVLEQQVRRMLADPRSTAMLDNFAGQWLHLRDLDTIESEAPDFNANLRQAFRRETEMLLATIMNEDRSVLELLDADYTFVDERLASYYGIPGVRGSLFRRVSLPEDSPRRGILGHGSILTVTSVPNRTSPVIRGQWILGNILGSPAPDPPPGVETDLSESEDSAVARTLRERLAQHRADPVCASCHNIMDPLGLVLENFDLAGKWREFDGEASIDPSARLVDGTEIRGPADLRRALLSRSDAFVTVMTEKMLTYALGRVVEYYDMPAVRAVVRRTVADEYRFSSMVLGIVESVPFRMRIKMPAEASSLETAAVAAPALP